MNDRSSRIVLGGFGGTIIVGIFGFFVGRFVGRRNDESMKERHD